MAAGSPRWRRLAIAGAPVERGEARAVAAKAVAADPAPQEFIHKRRHRDGVLLLGSARPGWSVLLRRVVNVKAS